MRVPSGIRRWLTGPKSDPSVRARYWLEVEGLPRNDPRVRSALKSIGRTGWAALLLKNQLPDGQWYTFGTTGPELYRPKYVATFWHALVLSDLGVTREDPRLRRTAELILRQFDQQSEGEEQLDYRPRGRNREVCVTGLVTRALIRFGYLDHPSVQRSLNWISRAQLGDGGWNDAPAKRGSLDAWQPLAALVEVPAGLRDTEVRQAIAKGAEFYLRRRLMRDGPATYEPWFRIHYPNHYYYDLLVGLRTLIAIGKDGDPRLAPALRWLRGKRAPDGSWALDLAHPDLDSKGSGYRLEELVFPMMLEQPREPSQWATVEALSVLARSQ
jgi:hypothetical protein